MTTNLTTEERRLFSLVAQASRTNPFSALRKSLDRKIADIEGGTISTEKGEDTIKSVIAKVDRRIARLRQEGRDDIRKYGEQDRQLVEGVVLFDLFHRFIPKFDALIADQMMAGERNLPVSFASKVLNEFGKRGFSRTDAMRYFELYFQMRRAFFFIQKNLVGRSACMQALRESLWNNVFTHNIDWYDRFLWNRMEDFSTLILGPTGAGKGTSAMAIGRSGYIPFDENKGYFAESFTHSFTTLNLSQFSSGLIESELFGHKEGAFTGAVENYKGIFSRCSPYGAIFLDEIGEVGQSIQIKLLKVLEERIFTPVGSHQPSRFAGRVIAATNRPLVRMREEGAMRDDFYYRLCSDVITIPSLAQRIAEDPLELDDLVVHTVGRILGKTDIELVEMIVSEIKHSPGENYPWPGNVRELEQCVRRILLNRSYLPDTQSQAIAPAERLAREMMAGSLDAQALLNGYCCLLYRQLGTYEAVARRTRLDRRTVKKYIMGSS